MRLRLAFSGLSALALVSAAAHADLRRWRAEGWKTDFSQSTVAPAEIVNGGPPRDGIPPIDRPEFRLASAIKDLDPQEPVIVFPLEPGARAYPLRVLMWHEIVNDTVDGAPVAVTYCPLCNTAIVFDRRIDGRVLDFGTSGKLRHSDLVMYDRQTESWWQQFTGEGLVGALAGKRLRLLPTRIEPFREFAAAHPNGPVLVPSDPAARRYGSNPYAGYDRRDQPYGLFQGDLPKGLSAMARVVVARGPDGPVSVSLSHLAEQKQLTYRGITFTWKPGAASALDHSKIASGRDIGFVTVANAAGRPIVHDVTFAFALHAFEPATIVLTEHGPVRLADGEPAS